MGFNSFVVRFALVVSAISLSACAVDPKDAAAAEANVKDETCYATGSNLPRRDCRDVVRVKPDDIERGTASGAPRNSAGGGR